MVNPLQITFRGMEPSEAVAARIGERAARLDHLDSRLIGCRVIFEQLHRSHHQGNLFHVRVDLTLPGFELVVGKDHGNHAHEDAYVAIRDAFDSLERRLREHQRAHDHRAKRHGPPVRLTEPPAGEE